MIGVADNCTIELAYVVLPKTGKMVIRKAVWAIEPSKMNDLAVIADLLELDKQIDEKYGDKTLKLTANGYVRATDLEYEQDVDELPPPPLDLFEGNEDELVDPVEPNEHSKEADEFTPEAMDEYLTAELVLPHVDSMHKARVVRRHRDDAGMPIGRINDNPILDSRMYDIEFPDGSTDVVSANLIAENLFSQVDDEGRQFQIIDEIVDCQFTDEAVKPEDGFVISQNGQKRPVITTKGCNMLVKFKDASAAWCPLHDLKIVKPS